MFPAISKEAFAAELGISEGVVDGWMRYDWTAGVEYVVKGRTTLINIERVTLWLNGLLASGLEDAASKSGYGDMEKLPTLKRSRATRTRSLTLPQRLNAVTN
jgi:hypothetical protein